MSATYDLIVIGGGPIGLSTAFHATQRGKSVLVLEKFGFLNDSGSSAGASRQFRLQYAQDYMAKLAIASQNYWAQLQAYTQETLVQVNGSLWFGDPAISSQEGGIAAAEKTMDQLGVPYTKLNAQEIEDRFHFKNIPKDYSGFFQANGGIINLKAAERALFDGCARSPQTALHEYESVTNIVSDSCGVTVTTDQETYHSRQLAICAGAYTNNVLEPLGISVGLDIWQMSSAYYKKTNPEMQLPTWFVFQDPADSALFYGFPEVYWSHENYIRVAPDFPDKILQDPSKRTFVPSKKNLGLNEQWVRDHMQGLDPTSRFTSTCLIALSKDSSKELLLDYVPDQIENHSNIVVYTAGWAAKYIPILGDTINQMLDTPINEVTYGDFIIPLSWFSIDWSAK